MSNAHTENEIQEPLPGCVNKQVNTSGKHVYPRPNSAAPWVVAAPANPECPPGLQYLTMVDQLLVKQKKELLEVMSDLETENRYVCLNTMGQIVYNCNEESNFCARQCCQSWRQFTIHIEDNTGQEVIRVHRPYKFVCISECFSCLDCCFDEVEVQAPVGQVVGYVKQALKGCTIFYHVLDSNRNTVLQIRGPHQCACHCIGSDINFGVLSKDGNHKVGTIMKQWSNVLQEFFTDATNFSVTFPMDLDVRFKAVLLGAVFLIDFMYFETPPDV